jgi:DNA-binding NtrC family response regulator
MPPTLLTAGLEDKCCKKIAEQWSSSNRGVMVQVTVASLVKRIQSEPPDLVVLGTDGKRPDDGIDTIRKIRSINGAIPIILISYHSCEARVISALRAGVSDYFKYPIPYPQLFRCIDQLASSQSHRMGIQNPDCSCSRALVIGRSSAMRDVKHYLTRVAGTTSTVLITGETGTGKGLAADYVHQHSMRATKKLVTVNCAALPEGLAESELFGYEKGAYTGAVAASQGKFAQANNSTLFLDEIGDMSPNIQAKILHTIERKVVYPLGGSKSLPLNVRIIAATNQEPEQLVAQGHFRKDLYYRLNIARVQLPPLRKRAEDIPDLVAYGIEVNNRRFGRNIQGLTFDAMDCLMRYDWPGNVRELMNLIEAVYVNSHSRQIDYAELPPFFRTQYERTFGRPEAERRAIIAALFETNWNKTRAARKLKWSRMTLYRKIERYSITDRGDRGPGSPTHP